MESILTSLKCEILVRNERRKEAMGLDDNRIHFTIHQRDAARISIEMTELTPMKGNLLQIVTNVNLSRVTRCVCASYTSSLHPRPTITNHSREKCQWMSLKDVDKKKGE